MPHVVTQSCCSDASCVFACPVNCIHPTPDEPDFATAEMLYVDPDACIDCGACITACPVDAIVPDRRLGPEQLPFLQINADFYKTPRERPVLAPVLTSTKANGDLTVAIVGSGPAAMYAADEVLKQEGATVHMYERLPQPYGLVRAGVAPDHTKTKQVAVLFDKITRERGFNLHTGVEVGRDVQHADLAREHHAVIYAVGASSDKRLSIPGAELASTATEFVGWYNGHPDHADHSFDLTQRRAVIVGNGNVALDVARILLTDPERLDGTTIDPKALAALRKSQIEEVVIVGRRGVEHSAFTLPELIGLLGHGDFDVLYDGSAAADTSHKSALVTRLGTEATAGRRRIVFRYNNSPEYIRDGVIGFSSGLEIEAGLILTSIGYHGKPVPGLPFDAATGTVPNEAGRVLDLSGVYVTGWIKRGPTGFIGTNKSCAHETVETLVADFNRGSLPSPVAKPDGLLRWLTR